MTHVDNTVANMSFMSYGEVLQVKVGYQWDNAWIIQHQGRGPIYAGFDHFHLQTEFFMNNYIYG